VQYKCDFPFKGFGENVSNSGNPAPAFVWCLNTASTIYGFCPPGAEAMDCSNFGKTPTIEKAGADFHRITTFLTRL